MALYPARFADPFDQMIDSIMGGRRNAIDGGALMRAPETDVFETEHAIRVVTEMPGLTRENIEVDVENNVLTIRGEKREETRQEEGTKYHLAERRWGTFTRSFVLPRDVDADNIQAEFENGVLTVTVPKSERARRRRIEVGGTSNSSNTEVGAKNNGREVGTGKQNDRSMQPS